MNLNLKTLSRISGWTVFTIAFFVYLFSVERTGSLWDCGEFILGAYRMQIVHPPGAPFFILVGRMFTWVADLVSDDPARIAFSVNLMSGICTAFAAMFVAWSTIIFGKLSMFGRDVDIKATAGENYALAGSGLVAGLTTAFCTSIWFSAVEGEVYAMSTFFTALTFWAMMKWYSLPDTPKNDRWIIFAMYAIGLSLGVHLLSLLTLPALGLMYYFKKYKEHTFVGGAIAFGIGSALVILIQKIVIVGIPTLWKSFDIFFVNSLGLPFHTGIIPTVLIVAAAIVFGLRYAKIKNNTILQMIVVATFMLIVGYSTFGIVVIRANANPPINMNDPSDATRLLPYLNREQYGERALLNGQMFDAKPIKNVPTDRYGRLGDRYEVVDKKYSSEYRSSDKMLFNRMTDGTQGRPGIYRQWIKKPKGRPTMGDNIEFFLKYQVNWMYVRYFMWNFSGRQNGAQGYYSWDKKSGHWITGIPFIDELMLYNQSELTTAMKNDEARNRYFALPFIFGLIGFFFHARRSRKDWMILFALFFITGLGLILYSNQPPNEPRERDYVLVGSFFAFSIWIGMAVMALFNWLKEKINGNIAAVVAIGVILIAPILMGTQNFDDHSRRHHTGARDYANNFLQSVDENAIIFTYGDNDTYPLWYAQEVEGIRPDVRVVNLSLIAVDWYISGLRRKVNDSPAIKLTIPETAYRGSKRIQTPVYPPDNPKRLNLLDVLKFAGEDHPLNSQGGGKFESYLKSGKLFIPVNNELARANGWVSDSSRAAPRVEIDLSRNYLIKDELAVLDVVASNINDRPVYFSVTCQQAKLQGMGDFTQLEGLGLRVIPQKTKSDGKYYIYGSGKIAYDKIYDNIMNKFKWGNFDKRKLYVDKSYGASVQAHRMIMLRAAEGFMLKGDKEKADAMASKFFEVFPNMNFTYDAKILPFINIFVRTGNYEMAKQELRTLAKETQEKLKFLYSLSDRNRNGSFNSEFQMANGSMRDVKRIAAQVADSEFLNEINAMFAEYETQQTPN